MASIFEDLMLQSFSVPKEDTTVELTESVDLSKVATPEVKKFNVSKFKFESRRVFESESFDELDKQFAVDPESEDEGEVVLVIDPEVTTEEELPEDAAESAIGSYVYKCPVCGSNYLCNCDAELEESVEVDDNGVPTECPICGDDADQILIGEIAPIDGAGEEVNNIDPVDSSDTEEEVTAEDEESEGVAEEGEGEDLEEGLFSKKGDLSKKDYKKYQDQAKSWLNSGSVKDDLSTENDIDGYIKDHVPETAKNPKVLNIFKSEVMNFLKNNSNLDEGLFGKKGPSKKDYKKWDKEWETWSSKPAARSGMRKAYDNDELDDYIKRMVPATAKDPDMFKVFKRNAVNDLTKGYYDAEEEGLFGKKNQQLFDVYTQCSEEENGKPVLRLNGVSEKEADKEVKFYLDEYQADIPGYKAWKEPHKDGAREEGFLGFGKKKQKASANKYDPRKEDAFLLVVEEESTGKRKLNSTDRAFDKRNSAEFQKKEVQKDLGNGYTVEVVTVADAEAEFNVDLSKTVQHIKESIKNESATHCVYFTQDGVEQIEFEGSEDECQDYIAKQEADNEFGDEAPERFVKTISEELEFDEVRFESLVNKNLDNTFKSSPKMKVESIKIKGSNLIIEYKMSLGRNTSKGTLRCEGFDINKKIQRIVLKDKGIITESIGKESKFEARALIRNGHLSIF